MKKNYDQESHAPPVIPPTLEEEYRHFKNYAEPGYSNKSQKAGFEEAAKSPIRSVLRSIFMPVAAIVASITLLAAARPALFKKTPLPLPLPTSSQTGSVLSGSETPSGGGDHDHAFEWRHAADEKGEYHYRFCPSCGEVTDRGEHDWALIHDESGHAWQCTVCSYISGEAMLPHSGGSATCIHKAVCDVCHEEYGDYSDRAHEGPLEIRGAKEATETENGYTGDEYCLACGKMVAEGQIIPSKNHVHTPVAVPEKAPDHHSEGNIAYYRCTGCQLCFTDESAENEIPQSETVLPAVPHSFEDRFDSEKHWKECSCGEITESGAHALSYETQGDSLTGTHRLYCSLCAYKGAEEAHTLQILHDASGHWRQCEICGASSAKESHGGTATCAHNAVCPTCGEVYGALDFSNHEGPFETRGAFAATESAEGYTGDVYCLACGRISENGASIPKLTHKHTMTSVAAKAATHYEEGNTAYYFCSGCGNYYSDAAGADQITKEQTVIAVIPHSYVWKSNSSTHWQECSCGSKLTSSAHTYGAWTTKTAASCETAGTRTRVCSVCAYTQSGQIAALGHDYALSTGVCSRCSDALVTVENGSVSLTPDNASSPISMVVGDDAVLTANFKSGVTATPEWSYVSGSAAASVLAVRSSGNRCTVHATASGSATVTLGFTYDGKAFALVFTFSVKPMPGLSLGKRGVYLLAGDTETLSATILNKLNSSDKPAFSSSDATVVRVDSSGRMTAVKSGEATITATYSYTSSGTTHSVTSQATVTVLPKVAPDSGTDYSVTYGSCIRYTNKSDATLDAGYITIFGDNYMTNFVDPPVSHGGISYNKTTNTLTLNGVSGGALEIVRMGSLKINVTGTNTLDAISVNAGEKAGMLFFTGSGSLTLNGDRGWRHGIDMYDLATNGYSNQYIVVKKGPTLTVYGNGTSPAINVYSYGSSAIYYEGTLSGGAVGKLDDSTLTVMTGDSGSSTVTFTPN